MDLELDVDSGPKTGSSHARKSFVHSDSDMFSRCAAIPCASNPAFDMSTVSCVVGDTQRKCSSYALFSTAAVKFPRKYVVIKSEFARHRMVKFLGYARVKEASWLVLCGPCSSLRSVGCYLVAYGWNESRPPYIMYLMWRLDWMRLVNCVS